MKMIGFVTGAYEDELNPKKSGLHAVYDVEESSCFELTPNIHLQRADRIEVTTDSKNKTKMPHNMAMKGSKRMEIKTN